MSSRAAPCLNAGLLASSTAGHPEPTMSVTPPAYKVRRRLSSFGHTIRNDAANEGDASWQSSILPGSTESHVSQGESTYLTEDFTPWELKRVKET